MDEPVALQSSDLTTEARLRRTVASETPRLRAFIRRRVEDLSDAEDIIQDTLSELVEAYRLMQPIEQVAGWLARVARNRIIDRYRARARESQVISPWPAPDTTDEEPAQLVEDWFAAAGEGPESSYVRAALADELEEAIAALPAPQRDVFIAHELEGRSFKDLAAATGVGINTLLGRKHAAVRALRTRLQTVYDEIESGDAP